MPESQIGKQINIRMKRRFMDDTDQLFRELWILDYPTQLINIERIDATLTATNANYPFQVSQCEETEKYLKEERENGSFFQEGQRWAPA